MTRNRLIQIHVALVGLFLPLFVIIPLSGTLYLLGIKGEIKKELIFESEKVSRDAEVIRSTLKQKNIDYRFESIKDKGDKIILRPSTRDHIQVEFTDDGMSYYWLRPNWVKSLQELHFGHGPKLLKNLQIAFGIGLFLVLFSGFVLLAGLKKHYKIFMGATLIGLLTNILPLVLQ